MPVCKDKLQQLQSNIHMVRDDLKDAKVDDAYMVEEIEESKDIDMMD